MAEALKQIHDYYEEMEAVPAYDPSYLAPSKDPVIEGDDFQEELPNLEIDISDRSRVKWTLFEKFWLGITVIISLLVCGLIISNQMDIREKEMSMLHLQQQIQSYQIQSEELRAEMALMYNYQDIKAAAEDAGLRIDKGRIGNLQR